MCLMFLSTVLCLTAAVVASEGEGSQLCADYPTIPEKACLTPYSYFVIWCTISILLAMVNDIEPDIVLMFATVMFSILPGPCKGKQRLLLEAGEEAHCTIITAEEAWQGFRAPAILAAATLLVFARCLEETRIVEAMITPILRGATNEVSAVARLAFPTFFFSSFLNSTPIVAMLIPVCETWCAKSGFKLTTVLMPLSFSAMLGGLTSLVGTASNMVLNAQIDADEEAPIYQFDFFTQAPAGVPAAIAGLAVMSFLAPVFLGKLGPTDAEAGGGGGASAAAPTLRASGTGALRGTFTAVDEHVQRGYDLEFLVQPNCALLNESLHTLQQTVLTGETNPYKDIATAAEAATPVPPPDGGLDPLTVVWLVRKDGTKHDASMRGWSDLRLHAGDKVGLSCAAHVVPTLRTIRGFKAAAEGASEALSGGAKRRCFFEAALTKASPLLGISVSTAAGHKKLAYTVLWSIRRSPIQFGASLRLGDSTKLGRSQKARLTSAKLGEENPLAPGDTLLLEADEDFAEAHKSDKGFSLIALVPGSLPAEKPLDAKPAWLVSLQFYASALSLVLMVVVSIFDWMTILPLSFLLAFGLVAVGCITPEQAWMSIKHRVILTIMAAFGLGAALDNTDVADIIAAALVTTGNALGAYPFLLIVFSATALLSFLVGSTPAIILLYAAIRIASVDGLKIGQSMMAMMLGAVCALATPIGFATNLMVQARAGYVFADFFLLGSIVTAVVGIVSCTIILYLPESMLPEARNHSQLPDNSFTHGGLGEGRRLDDFDFGFANLAL